VYDFGRIKAGELVKYSFVFTNNGDQPLELSNVQPSCGCTTAGDWSHKVMPGETGKVPIQFNSANFNGSVFKTVSVSSNDKQKPVIVLQLKGTIWKAIELIPPYTVLNVLPDATNASASIRIINNTDDPLTLSAPECSNNSFAATLSTIKPGKEFQLTLASVSSLAAGNAQGKISMKTSSTNTPTLDVPFWVNVQPALSIMPSQIMLPRAPLTAKAPTTVTIQNNTANAVSLSDPAVNVPGVDVEIKEVQPGKIYHALLTFPEGFEIPAGQSIALTMKSTSSQVPQIKVPIHQATAASVPVPQTLKPQQPPTATPGAPGHPVATGPAIH